MRALTIFLVSAVTMLAPVLASADPATAQAAPAPSVQAAQVPTVTVTGQKAPSPDEVVCRMSPPETGSRIGGARECHTAREWDRRQQEAQRILQASQRMGLQGMATSSLSGGPPGP